MLDSQDSLHMRVGRRHYEDKRVIIPFLLFLLAVLVSCVPASTGEPKQQPTILSPTIPETAQLMQTLTSTISLTASVTAQSTQMITPSATRCPRATRESFWVEPVTSPTDQLSQVIAVHIGKGEEVTVVTESGTFTVTGKFGGYGNPALVEISLLPNTVHHLEVTAKVRRVPGSSPVENCMYGGYTLRTTRDSQGSPLTIVQRESVP